MGRHWTHHYPNHQYRLFSSLLCTIIYHGSSWKQLVWKHQEIIQKSRNSRTLLWHVSDSDSGVPITNLTSTSINSKLWPASEMICWQSCPAAAAAGPMFQFSVVKLKCETFPRNVSTITRPQSAETLRHCVTFWFISHCSRYLETGRYLMDIVLFSCAGLKSELQTVKWIIWSIKLSKNFIWPITLLCNTVALFYQLDIYLTLLLLSKLWKYKKCQQDNLSSW